MAQKLQASVKLDNVTDNIVSIDGFTFPTDTPINQAHKFYTCAVTTYHDEETYTNDIYLVMGVPEGSQYTVSFSQVSTDPEVNGTVYTRDTAVHVVPVLDGTEGILFGGRPRPRPPKSVQV